jgi:hypothetical protein
MLTKFVKPGLGQDGQPYVMRHPRTKRLIPADGVELLDNHFLKTRLKDGSLVPAERPVKAEAEAAPAPAPEQAQEQPAPLALPAESEAAPAAEPESAELTRPASEQHASSRRARVRE